jgi:hypothetical protein
MPHEVVNGFELFCHRLQIERQKQAEILRPKDPKRLECVEFERRARGARCRSERTVGLKVFDRPT